MSASARGHAAADRVAGDRHPLRVEPVRGALADDPPGGRVALLDRDRVAGLGRAVVLDEHERGAGADGQLAHEPVVRPGVAEHPAAAVHVEDHRAACPSAPAGRTMRTLDVADVGRHGDPALVDGQLVDRRRLDVVEHLARLVGRQLVQERRLGGRLDERLRRRARARPVGRGRADMVVPLGRSAVRRRTRSAAASRIRSRRRVGLRDGDGVRGARRARPCARAPARSAMKRWSGGRDDAVLLADQEPRRHAPSTADARPTARRAPPGWPGAASPPSARPAARGRPRRTCRGSCRGAM